MAIRPPLTATVRGGQGKPDRDEEMDVSWSNKEMETGRRSNLTIIAPYKAYWEEFGVNHMIIRTHWVGMPLSTSLASMRLISDELLPALQGVSPGVRLGSAPA